jgi:hypothetical protein
LAISSNSPDQIASIYFFCGAVAKLTGCEKMATGTGLLWSLWGRGKFGSAVFQ